MTHAQTVLKATAVRLLSIQGLIVISASFGFFVTNDSQAAQSALAGGLIALLNTTVSVFFLNRATTASSVSPSQSLLLFYFGAATRFILVPLLFGLGIALLSFNPIAMLICFALAQLAYLFNKVRT